MSVPPCPKSAPRRKLAAFRFPPGILAAIRARAAARGMSQADYLSELVSCAAPIRGRRLPQ
jgi:predicted DNA binding CopG/RHH family protein